MWRWWLLEECDGGGPGGGLLEDGGGPGGGLYADDDDLPGGGPAGGRADGLCFSLGYKAGPVNAEDFGGGRAGVAGGLAGGLTGL